MSAYSLPARTSSARTLLHGKAVLGLLGLALSTGLAAAQRATATPAGVNTSCTAARGQGAVAMHAPAGKAGLSLCDGYALASGGGSAGTPLALASSDFDGDGVPDLVSGFASGAGGSVVIHRGNVAALWPYGAAIQNGTPAAFLPNPRTFSLPEAPEFIAAGDFDGDGHADIVAARSGSSALYFLKGNGKGGFAQAKRIELAGAVTDMIAGEVNRADGMTDLVVGISGAGGSAVLVYQSPKGALKEQPETFALSQPVSALAIGKFSGSSLRDLAIGAGSELTLIHGRDRMRAPGSNEAVVTRQTLPFSIRALASGDFTGRSPSVAVLGGDGSVHVMEHSVLAETLADTMGNASTAPSMQVAGNGSAEATGSALTSGAQTRVAAVRAMALQGSAAQMPEWSERSTVALPVGFNQGAHALVAAHISGSLQEDLLVVDAANSQVHVLSTLESQKQFAASAAASGSISAAASGSISHSATRPGTAQMSLLTSLAATTTPAAILPMRLSQHGLSGLVALQSNVGGLVVMPQDVAPTAVFTVTNTLDITSASQKDSPPAGSLRAAMEAAQAASGDNGGGTYSIVFNIPTSDPGYNAATGVFKIQPLSENVPNSFDNFALPPINATLTIDGYTQPGASPNTSATADNAKILIQIDGSKATTTGGSGFVPFDDIGTVIRGIAFTGWTNPAISNNTASGAEGIEANGVGDFIEGNFFGTADGTTASPNRIGIFADNGPLFGTAPGNTIGGTTPQARNILSGNNNSGILFLSTSYEAQLQGNFVGLDATGNTFLSNPQQAIRSNTFDGVGLNGPDVTIGGTAPGAANYIAGNGTNVDLNDLTNGGAAKNSLVAGNIVGMDATGTHGIANQGYGVSILHSVSNMTIGGATPAARNVISGNLAGVYVFDSSFNNVVQGNYIGTDVTGAVAVPNTQQGFISGRTTSTAVPAGNTTITGNVISGNTLDGVQVNGTSQSSSSSPFLGNTIQSNLIGTDATGTKSLPNQGNGVSILLGGTSNTIGGSSVGLGNVIANNALNGVLIDPGTGNGPAVANVTIANTIYSNSGAGVRIKSGSANRISSNSIYGNGALGIDIDAAGPGTNSHCNATNSGANMLQNYPVLTTGTGTTYISATATDPSGNTSEFSKAVLATQPSANMLSLLGSFDGTANTKFTLEFFSNTAADASGYGQGQTYLGSATITTDANCAGAINDPVDTTQADVSVNLTQSTRFFQTGPDFGLYSYTATVTNNGPAIAHSVVLTDVLPAQLKVSSTYCNVGLCQIPITTTQGTCTVSDKVITCNLGALATGGTANITIPVQALATGNITNTVNVSATEVDPNLLNNTSSQTANATNPYPFVDHLAPTTVLANSPDLILNIYGEGFTSNLTATFNGAPVQVLGLVDNQVCGGTFSSSFCSALQVVIPAAKLTTPGSFEVDVTNPDGQVGSANLTVAAACTYSVFSDLDSDYENDGTNLIAGAVFVTTNVSSCPWTATSTVPWAVILDNASATGSATVDVAIAPNTTTSTRSGSVTIAGTTTTFTQDAGSSAICSVTLDPSSVTAPAAGGAGSINATLSSSGCAPFAEPYPDNGWITITSKSNLLIASGPVAYTLAPNNGPARTGAITVGGNVTTITQTAPSCYFTLSASSVLAPTGGVTGSITVTPTPSSCAWTATSSNASQVSVTSGASGIGVGTVSYTVAPNTAGPITPTITIGNSAATSVFTINQASAYTCTFTVSPTPVSVTSNGTSNLFSVKASFGFCKWTASSNNPDSIFVTEGASGTGSGTVFYSVGKNTGAARTLTITAGCQTFTVNQDGSAVTSPAPVLTSLQPSSVTAGSAAFTLTVNGTGFVSGSVVNLNGSARTTTYVSATQLTASIPASDITTPGTAAITVVSPTPGGGTSNSLNLTISTVSNNPVPTLTSLQPSSATAGSAGFTLTVNGTNFVSASVINFGSTVLTTTYVSAAQLTASVPASLIATTGTPAVTVTNPAPGGGSSNALTFTVSASTNPVPTLTSLQPSSATAGSAAFTLTVSGTNFVSASAINFGGTALATTYVSATQLTATVPASLIASTGTPSVTVTNPTPGGGTSNALTFTINVANNPVPTLTALQPSSATTGSSAFTLTVSGTNFVSASVVNFGGTALATTYVSATQVTATVPASLIAATGTPSVTVTNPTPGGGASNALTFTISAASNPVPTLAALQPSSTTVGSASFTLTVTGTNFVSGSVISFGGTALTTTYISATQLTATVPASSVAATGTPSVTVTNPTPGGGTSNALTFTVSAANNPAPTLTALQPSSVAVGSGAFTLTVTGTNFLSSSKVNFNGTALTTTYVSATQLTAAVPASNVASAGTPAITVTNPTPGGGTSNSLALTVTAAPTFALSSSGAQTASPGSTVQYTITAAAMNGTYATPVALSISGLPSGATAVFNPTSITPNATSAQSVLTITLPQTAAGLIQSPRGLSLACLGLPFLGLLMLRRSQRKRFLAAVTLLLGLVVSTGTLTGCGNNGFNYSTISPQTYTLVVTGTSGSVTVTTNLQLTVNYVTK